MGAAGLAQCSRGCTLSHSSCIERMTLSCGIRPPVLSSARMPARPSSSLRLARLSATISGVPTIAAPRLVPGEALQPLGALNPPCGVKDAGAVSRFLEARTQIAVEIHQAFPGVGERLFEGVSDIDRGAQVDLALAQVSRSFPGLAIGVQIRQDLVEGAAPRTHKDRITLLGGGNERILAIGCDADRRMRLAVGLWYDADVF